MKHCQKESPSALGDSKLQPNNAMGRRCALKVIGVAAIASLPRRSDADPHGKVLGRGKTGPSPFKAQASEDYVRSLGDVGGMLTSPAINLRSARPGLSPWQFDILVIGSGYGASTVAARLAQRKQPHVRIAMLERGREWIPGTFPDRLRDVLKESRVNLLGRRKGTIHQPLGLFNVQQFHEITVMSGSGLGGSSLINASVAIRPDCDVFDQTAWPSSLRSSEYLAPYYELAEYELGVQPERIDSSHKMIASRYAGERLHCRGANWQPASLAVARSGLHPTATLPVVNRQGMLQRGCIDCGDCLTGCNVGAKGSLAMNYLPLARRAGVEMYTGVEVQFIRKLEHCYEVHYKHYVGGPDGQIWATEGCATARMVVLGAGSLGSTEILLRSQHLGMNFSERLGQSWTGNGDALGFVRKTDLPTGIGGYSAYESDRFPVGPTIQTNLTYPSRPRDGRVLIQDGAVPRSYANALGVLMRNPRLDRTHIMLAMGHDGAAGRISLDQNGNCEVCWPGLLESDYRQFVRCELRNVAEAMGGKYEYLRIFGNQMVSVHPLGGCAMGDDVRCGVVTDRGEVFNAATGSVHENLFVIDGAMLPTSIACNPLLTITALAERASDRIVNDPRLAYMFVPER